MVYFTVSSTDSVEVTSVDVAEDGYIYAVGNYKGTLKTSYSSSILPNISTIGNREGFVVRINPYDELDDDQFLMPVGNTASATTYIYDCKYVSCYTASFTPIFVLSGKFKGSNVDLNLSNNTSPYSSSLYAGFVTSISADSARATGSGYLPIVITGSGDVSVQKLCMPRHLEDIDTLNFVGVYSGTTSTTPVVSSVGGNDILLGVSRISFGFSGPYAMTELDYKSIGSAGNDGVSSVIINENLNRIFLSGYFNSSTGIDVDPGASSVLLGASANVDAFASGYDRLFNYDNVVAYHFTGLGDERITSMALWDYAGDTLLIGGYFTGGTISYNSINLHNNISTTGTPDGFINLIKTGATGSILGGIRIGDVSDDYVNSVVVSAYGEAVAAGAFSGTVDFDNGSGVYQETSSNMSSFISYYGEDLSAFVDSYTAGHDDDEVISLSIDDKGDIFAIGTYTGSINIGSNTLNSAGGTDVFIQKKDKKGANEWAFNAGRMASSTIQDICSRINSTANDKGRSVVNSDTSVYIAYVKNDTAYTQRVNKNTGGPIWTQKINQNGSDIAEITADAAGVYLVGDSAGVQITQRVNKNTGGPIWTQRSPGGKSKAMTQDNAYIYTVKDSSGSTVLRKVNKNTGGPIWTQRIAGNSGTSIATVGDDLYVMSDSAGSIMLRKVNKNTGGPIWTQKVGNGTLGKVSINSKGNLYITGNFTGSSSYLGVTSSGGTDGFVARVNKNTGGPIWTQKVGGSAADTIKTLQVAPGGDIYIGGNTQGGTFGTYTAGDGVFLVRLSVDSLDAISSISPISIQNDAFHCQVYPNPTRDMFNISAILPKNELVQIRLVDLRGSVVYQEMYGTNAIQNTIDVGELPNGVYILQIQAGNKQVIRKVIKQ